MKNKEITAECTELDELEYINNLVAERMKRIQEAQWEHEAKMEHRRVQHEKRMNAIVRMISVIGLYTAMVVALVILAYTQVVVWWLSGSVALGLALCGAFRAGYYWREHEI
jgi:hypothetical protein